MNRNHSLLLKKQLRHANADPPRKKRRRRNPDLPGDHHPIEVENDSSDSSDDLEDVDLAVPEEGATSARETSTTPATGDSDASDEFEDLEDVDLDQIFTPPAASQPPETLTFHINQEKPEDAPKGRKRKFVPVSKEERHRRKLIHKLYLETMVAHGVVRNQWCNNQELHSELRKAVPSEIKSLFRLTNDDVLDFVKTRRFTEGLRKALAFYNKKFRVISQGIVRRSWDNMLKPQEYTDGKVTLTRFKRLIRNFRGSRDLGAQGFVALLRSIGVTARLVFSIQPPDYRSIVPVEAANEDKKDDPAKTEPASEFDPVFIPSLKQEFLADSRRSTKEISRSRREFSFPKSKYPLFWIEVWNKFLKKWITVDPVVLNVVEVMPMRRKCKFEPPATDATCQSWYVIAYDVHGNVKDVTRRYTQYYNAKTVKKRIEFASDEDEHWYMRLLQAAKAPNVKLSEADIMETKEFYDRDVCEGIPNNMADFKNHPVYALESQLRQDEVIYPKDESSKCGSFRPLNKNSIMPVYKRSHVFRLRTAKAWYMRGRVLKIGVQPLKTKAVPKIAFDEDDDDDGLERLYAEFQTEMYKAPPIVDGKITKNAYGNLEIYTPTMMPDNGFLARVTDKITMKMLERAAREFLRIDYARAIVAFDFGGTKNKRTPTAREGGVVIDKQYKEAMLLILEQLQEMEEDDKRRQVELNALHSWRFFMTKLKIMKRLDKQHGRVVDEEDNVKSEVKEEEDDGYFSVASDNDSSGGEDNYRPQKRRRFEQEREERDEFEEGGFEEGGFVLDGTSVEQGHEQTEFPGEGGFVSEGGFQNDGEFDSEGGFLGDGGFVSEGGFISEEVEYVNGFNPEEGGFLVDSEAADPELANDGGVSDNGAVQDQTLDNGEISPHTGYTNRGSDLATQDNESDRSSDKSQVADKSPSTDKWQQTDTSHGILLDRAMAPISEKVAKCGSRILPPSRAKLTRQTSEVATSEIGEPTQVEASNIQSITSTESKSSEALGGMSSSSKGDTLSAGRGHLPPAAKIIPSTRRSISSPNGDIGDVFVITSESEEASDHDPSDESVILLSDSSEVSRIEKEEQELGLEYSDSE